MGSPTRASLMCTVWTSNQYDIGQTKTVITGKKKIAAATSHFK